MKNVLCVITVLFSISAFAAQIKSDHFSINLEYNKHSKPDDFKLVVVGSCDAYSFLGDTNCRVVNNRVTAKKIDANNFEVPRFKFKSSTDGYLVTSYEMTANVYLQNDESRVNLYAYHSEKSSLDISKAVRKYFENPIYISTIPSFEFKSSGELISSKVTSPKLNLRGGDIDLRYFLLDDDGNEIEQVKWNAFTIYDYVETNSKLVNGKVETLVNERIFATSIKPHSLKVVIKYNVKYYGKYTNIVKVYKFDDLDNLDLSREIGSIKLQIVDEDIE